MNYFKMLCYTPELSVIRQSVGILKQMVTCRTMYQNVWNLQDQLKAMEKNCTEQNYNCTENIDDYRDMHPEHKNLKTIMGSSTHKRNQDLDYKLEIIAAYGCSQSLNK